jgi:3'-5' exoribonuclease
MACGTNAELDVLACRARFVLGAACAHEHGLLVFGMNVWLHDSEKTADHTLFPTAGNSKSNTFLDNPANLNAWCSIMSEDGCHTIAAVRELCRASMAGALVRAQIEDLAKKESSNGKPYWELKLRDATDSLTLRAWSDTEAFVLCQELSRGVCVEVTGEFSINGGFGLDARRWRLRTLDDSESRLLFEGTPQDIEAMEKDFADVGSIASQIEDPRLSALCTAFLADFGPRFKRAAAARRNHHAHRGGLLRHTAQMMRSSMALCTAYPSLNRDILLAGALFHDSGKLWEMCPPEQGFEIPRDIRGELLGHISIGVELVNTLWRKLPLENWRDIHPPSEEVRLHLLHLVAAHHGELQYGSPIEPKTPEAIALHMIDNLDARLEMFSMAYINQPEIAPGIHDRFRPLNTSPVKPLARFGTMPAAEG